MFVMRYKKERSTSTVMQFFFVPIAKLIMCNRTTYNFISKMKMKEFKSIFI